MIAIEETPFNNLRKENECLRHENDKLHAALEESKKQVDWFRNQIFGKKSERIIDPADAFQLELPGFDSLDVSSEELEDDVPARKRKKRKATGKDAIVLPDDLPVERQIIDLPEQEKFSKDGTPLVCIGEEVTQKLAHKAGSYFIKEIVRPKYASPKESDEGIRTAALPETLLQRCMADESFLADILVKKFADHLPLYRQCEILAREGIQISRQTMSQWVNRCGLALKPIYEAMQNKIRHSGNLFLDESPVDMLNPGKGKVKETYMWVMVGGVSSDPPYRVYHFRTSRQHKHAQEILGDYRGVVHSDKYGAYETLANKKQFTWCPCWAHIRRKFIEAESGDLEFRAWILRKIRYLYTFERIAWTRSPEERLRIRKEKEEPIIDEIIFEVKKKLQEGKLLPKSKLNQALCYVCGLIPHLKNYLKHAWARIDNNPAERAVRPLAIGRKNWLFIGSEEGGEASAIILSLVQTCRAMKINPREYLEDVMRRLMSHSALNIEELLPDAWAAAKNKS
jgi:transposase